MQLLARAIDDSTRAGTPILDAVHSAPECGRTIGDLARLDLGPRPFSEQKITAACAALTAYGYEPPARGRDHHSGQLPLRRVGPRAHRAGLRDEPRAARRGR